MMMTKSRAFEKVQQREQMSWWGYPEKAMGSEGDAEIKGVV